MTHTHTLSHTVYRVCNDHIPISVYVVCVFRFVRKQFSFSTYFAAQVHQHSVLAITSGFMFTLFFSFLFIFLSLSLSSPAFSIVLSPVQLFRDKSKMQKQHDNEKIDTNI